MSADKALSDYFKALHISSEHSAAVVAAGYTLLTDLGGVEVQELLAARIKPPVARKLVKNFANRGALLNETSSGGGGGGAKIDGGGGSSKSGGDGCYRDTHITTRNKANKAHIVIPIQQVCI